MSNPLTLKQRQDLCTKKVTLNGEPAAISGALHDFARVTQLESGLGCQWAWPTVLFVVTRKEGKFTS